jgi:formylmethanofuran dehydrogenase subunit E
MVALQWILEACADQHQGRLCPRQVLGARMGMLAGQIFPLDLPQRDKRMVALIETDGCFTDGVAVATGCRVGRRTMFVFDYGKTAVTFVDTHTGKALRVRPHPSGRERASLYAPDQPDSWHAQLFGYQVMPDDELLIVETVRLNLSLETLISQPGYRVVCSRCGEEIMNERELVHGDTILCKPCAGEAYFIRKAA